MKSRISWLTRIVLFSLCFLIMSVPAYAAGEGNVDGGGGSMGQGSSQNFWSPGDEGVRVSVISTSDHKVVGTPIDLTNKSPSDIRLHFGKVSKMSYTSGHGIGISGSRYQYIRPAQRLPIIISSQSLGPSSIAEIKRYFTDEQTIRGIAGYMGIDFDILISGEYRIMIEPIAYVTLQGVRVAMTATEAALYDEVAGGVVYSWLRSVTFQNLPLAMFLEKSDLGYPAWNGPTTGLRSHQEIKTSLGLGIIRFNGELPEPSPEVTTFDYEYRTNTEVITSIRVSGGQSDPDHKVSVTFKIQGRNYKVDSVYYPEGGSQLAWVRWTTPSTEQTMEIPVTVRGGGRTDKGTIRVKIVNLDKNPPPNPVADDRNDSYARPAVPSKSQQTSADWSIWRPYWYSYWVWHSGDDDDDGYWCDHGWWKFNIDRYHASLNATMRVQPDDKSPTAHGKTLKSGYGFNEYVNSSVSTNQSSAVTGAQNAVTYFPEFQYKKYWRLLERMSGGYHSEFEFKKNQYSTFKRRTHFTPIWMPDGKYTPYTWLIEAWTPAGMLSLNLTDNLTISGNLWTDWHIAPQRLD